MKKQLLAASLLLSALTSFGAGYQLNLQGLRQLAMGGSGTAWPWDASTIFYNPGGLARLKSIQVYACGLFIAPATAFGNGIAGSSTRSQAQTFTPFNMYVGGPIQQDSRFALGMGIYTSAGVGLKWNDDWLGKYIVQSISLEALSFQPTISYRFSDLISVGAGFVYTMGLFDYRNAVPVETYYLGQTTEGEAHLHGAADGVGFNVGVQLKPSDNLQLGITYRSQVNMSLSGGSATFNVPKSLASSFPNTQFDSQLPLPQVGSVGIGYRPDEHLTLQFDLNFTGWSTYDSLRINFSQHTSSLQDMHEPRHYRNTLTPRIGACYKISKVVSLMAGGAYDPTPVVNNFVSPDLPDADRIVLTCGISVKPLPRFTILAAFEGTNALARTGNYMYYQNAGVYNFTGTYKTEAACVGIGAYYNF
jgi:long-chain fatty acid transport protein